MKSNNAIQLLKINTNDFTCKRLISKRKLVQHTTIPRYRAPASNSNNSNNTPVAKFSSVLNRHRETLTEKRRLSGIPRDCRHPPSELSHKRNHFNPQAPSVSKASGTQNVSGCQRAILEGLGSWQQLLL